MLGKDNVTCAIDREVFVSLYDLFENVVVDSALIADLSTQIERAMRNLASDSARLDMASACASIWMPSPSSVNVQYNTTRYNTIEVFCLCVQAVVENGVDWLVG